MPPTAALVQQVGDQAFGVQQAAIAVADAKLERLRGLRGEREQHCERRLEERLILFRHIAQEPLADEVRAPRSPRIWRIEGLAYSTVVSGGDHEDHVGRVLDQRAQVRLALGAQHALGQRGALERETDLRGEHLEAVSRRIRRGRGVQQDDGAGELPLRQDRHREHRASRRGSSRASRRRASGSSTATRRSSRSTTSAGSDASASRSSPSPPAGSGPTSHLRAVALLDLEHGRPGGGARRACAAASCAARTISCRAGGGDQGVRPPGASCARAPRPRPGRGRGRSSARRPARTARSRRRRRRARRSRRGARRLDDHDHGSDQRRRRRSPRIRPRVSRSSASAGCDTVVIEGCSAAAPNSRCAAIQPASSGSRGCRRRGAGSSRRPSRPRGPGRARRRSCSRRGCAARADGQPHRDAEYEDVRERIGDRDELRSQRERRVVRQRRDQDEP